MSTIHDLVCLDPPAWTTYSTGFARLDELTQGFAAGSVWLVTGTPGQGCTTLLTQWAGRLATQHALATLLVAPREDERHCACRVLSSLGRVPTVDLLHGGTGSVDGKRLQVGLEALSGARLVLRCGQGVSLPSWSEDAPGAVLLDDADLVADAAPARIRALADSGVVVIASLPRHVLVPERGHDGDLHPDWARVADVILELRSQGLEPGLHGERMGEADVTVLKHRRGPTTSLTVAFEGHHSRFVDLR